MPITTYLYHVQYREGLVVIELSKHYQTTEKYQESQIIQLTTFSGVISDLYRQSRSAGTYSLFYLERD